jgi:hypothetical protein
MNSRIASVLALGGTGRYEGSKGTLINHGETDLKRGLLTLRYDGRICGVAP